MGDTYGIEGIVTSYDFVLMDTNVIINPFTDSIITGEHNQFIKELKTSEIQRETDYIVFLQEGLRKGYPLYMTYKVLKELEPGNIKGYKKSIKHSSNRKNFVSPKTIERKDSETNRLISLLQNYHHIVDLSPEQALQVVGDKERKLYDNLSKEFSYLKNSEKLSDADFDFIITGMVLYQKRGPTALMTNDGGIRRSWFSLTENGTFNTSELGLFKAIGLTHFVRPIEYLRELRKTMEENPHRPYATY